MRDEPGQLDSPFATRSSTRDRDAKLGGALRHLPSGYPQVDKAWMWGALLAVNIVGWLHQLTATPGPDGQLAGWGVRDSQAMIATLRHRLIRVPARLVRHAGALELRLPPGAPPARRGPRPHTSPPRNVLTRPNGPDTLRLMNRHRTTRRPTGHDRVASGRPLTSTGADNRSWQHR